MKKVIKTLSLIALFAIPFVSTAQDCHNTVKYCPHGKKDGYVYNGQSVSGAFVQGDTAEITIIVYKDMEYRMSICSPNNYQMNGKFQFQVVEMITKAQWEETKTYVTEEKFDEDGQPIGEEKVEKVTRKRVYKKSPVVRYDNSKDEDSQEFIFVSDKTRKLTIKVYVPNMEGVSEGDDLEGDAYACVGFLIEHQPGPKTGFRR